MSLPHEPPRRHQRRRPHRSAHRRTYAAHRGVSQARRVRPASHPRFPRSPAPRNRIISPAKRRSEHGIVGNGWFNRELAEVQFWKQSNHIVHGRKIWDELRARDPKFTCANCFWWFNMYSSVDYSITPRPMYPADGRKLFDIYSWPYSIREQIKYDLGEFPFFSFWGPAAGVDSPQGRPMPRRAGLPNPPNGLKTNIRRR